MKGTAVEETRPNVYEVFSFVSSISPSFKSYPKRRKKSSDPFLCGLSVCNLLSLGGVSFDSIIRCIIRHVVKRISELIVKAVVWRPKE